LRDALAVPHHRTATHYEHRGHGRGSPT
jgi:hypothetical protein